MSLPTTRRAFANLLFASPPGVRSVLARHLFTTSGGTGIGVTRSLTTFSARRDGTRTFTAIPIPRTKGYISRARLQSPAALSSSTASASASRTSSDILNPLGSTTTPPPRRPSRLRRILFTSSLIVIFFTAGFGMAASPVAEAVNGYLNPPSDEDTLTLFEPPTPTSAEINEHIVNHPLAQKLRQQEGFVESRPHLKIPAAMRPHNLTAGTLLGENMIEVPPLSFSEKEAELPSFVQIFYLGPALCGHPGIVHGGLLATMLDEGLARCCFPALPNKVGVTASLKIDYRVPCPGSSYVVLKAETTKVEGRKAWVKGWIEILGEEESTGTKVVEAEALFIEPKQAKQMARIYSTT